MLVSLTLNPNWKDMCCLAYVVTTLKHAGYLYEFSYRNDVDVHDCSEQLSPMTTVVWQV